MCALPSLRDARTGGFPYTPSVPISARGVLKLILPCCLPYDVTAITSSSSLRLQFNIVKRDLPTLGTPAFASSRTVLSSSRRRPRLDVMHRLLGHTPTLSSHLGIIAFAKRVHCNGATARTALASGSAPWSEGGSRLLENLRWLMTWRCRPAVHDLHCAPMCVPLRIYTFCTRIGLPCMTICTICTRAP